MNQLELAVAQIEVVRGAPEKNVERVSQLAADAASRGAVLLCLPEMFTTGFDWKRIGELRAGAADAIAAVAEAACRHRISICGSLLEPVGADATANAFHFFDREGNCRAKYRKAHLFSLFNEQRHIASGDAACVFDAGWGPAAAAVCYDLRFPELFRISAQAGARVHFLPSAFPEPRLEHWRTLLRARAIENQMYVVAVNQCGREAGSGPAARIRYFGHSMVVDPWGDVLFEAGDRPVLETVTLDLDRVTQVRRALPALGDRRPDVYARPPSDGLGG